MEKMFKNLDEVCTKIAKQTDDNDHTGAKLTAAYYFELKHYIKIFVLIEYLHDAEGYLPEELSNYRRRKGLEMMQEIKNRFPEQFEKINKYF